MLGSWIIKFKPTEVNTLKKNPVVKWLLFILPISLFSASLKISSCIFCLHIHVWRRAVGLSAHSVCTQACDVQQKQNLCAVHLRNCCRGRPSWQHATTVRHGRFNRQGQCPWIRFMQFYSRYFESTRSTLILFTSWVCFCGAINEWMNEALEYHFSPHGSRKQKTLQKYYIYVFHLYPKFFTHWVPKGLF